MFKKIALAVALVLGSLTAVAQHEHGGGERGGHTEHYGAIGPRNEPVGHRSDFRGHNSYQYNTREGGRFVGRAGYWRNRPYYGGLRIYNGVNIFPCTEFDFVNGYCYPYDYTYYPQYYSGFHVGINIR